MQVQEIETAITKLSDELSSEPESKQVMRAMAQEAVAEYHAGQTTGIAVTEDGRLAPV